MGNGTARGHESLDALNAMIKRRFPQVTTAHAHITPFRRDDVPESAIAVSYRDSGARRIVWRPDGVFAWYDGPDAGTVLGGLAAVWWIADDVARAVGAVGLPNPGGCES